ncbi:MAG TPA: zf-HC2 domain-containing protein [Pyrinomonadaceae bacterium]|nr:zf-HC2 domain-containing protein [Pyrinomonadaceae bacterium]
MFCEETEQSLSLYLDNILSLPARVAVDQHLTECPVCRAHLADLRLISRSLRELPQPTPPLGLAHAISGSLMIEAAAREQSPETSLAARITRWVQPRLMPYTVGSFASVILFISMFAALRPHIIALREAAAQTTLYSIQPVTPEDYAASRAPFAEQSPSLNPSGALAALTRSYSNSQNEMAEEDADDMIVVTYVFSNGSASLADVVHPPRDRRMLEEFQSALRQNAAFVPASFDRRPDTMRVVFAVQKVDVRERNF